jgi:outer membrane protein assembly factor BamD (BamD/ComL family)
MKKRIILFVAVFLSILFVVGCAKLPDDRLMEIAKEYESREKFTEAIETYKKLVKTYPKSPLAPEAIYRAGLVYINGLSDVENSVEAFEAVIIGHPDSEYAPQCQFMIGFVYANSAADTARARIAYNTFLNKYPDHDLIPSVTWELKYLGKDINEIPELKNLNPDE